MGIAAISQTETSDIRGVRRALPMRLQLAAVAGLVALLYGWTLADMAHAWWIFPQFSQGMLIPPLALYLAWQNRNCTFGLPVKADSRGLSLIFASCLMFLAGQLGAEYFLQRIAFVILLAGLTWTFWGRARLRSLAFPFLLLATMVPLPAILYNAVATPLQLLASDVATRLAQFCGITVYQDGNIIHLANISLGVEEACSGLSSLSVLVVSSLLLGQIYSCSILARIIVLSLSIPIAIAANVIRVAGTAVLADSHEELAMGFYHAFSGWLVFVSGYLMLSVVSKAVRLLVDGHKRTQL